MTTTTKRKTSLTLDAAALDQAKSLGVNVSAVAEAALIDAVDKARRAQWLAENAAVFEAQARWHSENGHPLAGIMAGPGSNTWNS